MDSVRTEPQASSSFAGLGFTMVAVATGAIRDCSPRHSSTSEVRPSSTPSSSAFVLFTRQLVGDNSFIMFGGFGECDWLEQGHTTWCKLPLRARQRMRSSNHESRPVQPQTPRFRDTRVTCRTHKDIDLRACLWLLGPLSLIAGQPCRL
jgi:hypothetical protein